MERVSLRSQTQSSPTRSAWRIRSRVESPSTLKNCSIPSSSSCRGSMPRPAATASGWMTVELHPAPMPRPFFT